MIYDYFNRNLVVPFLFISFLNTSAYSQEQNLEIFGYFEPQITGFVINDEFLQMASNKLRLDVKSAISDRITFKANFNYITYHGATTFYITDFFADEITSGLLPGMREAFSLTFTDENYLDNAYVKISMDKFDISAGKIQISPGTGYAWNPTDIFNTKDLFDPTYEQPGQNAVQIEIPLGNETSFSAIYNPEDNFSNSGKFARFKWKMGHFDLSASAGEKQWPFTDYLAGLQMKERKRIAGGDLAGELFGLGVWAEAAYNYMELSGDYFEGLVGFDYTFDSGLYILSEFYRNEQGKADYKAYTFNDWMRSYSAETRALSRDQVFLYTSYPATDLLTLGGSVIASLNDGSMAVVPSAVYNFDDNMDITFFGNIYVGAEGKTFSSKLGTGGLLRLRYYF